MLDMTPFLSSEILRIRPFTDTGQNICAIQDVSFRHLSLQEDSARLTSIFHLPSHMLPPNYHIC